MWEEARGLHPSYQVPELDQNHHPKGDWLLRCLANLRAPPPEHPDQARPRGKQRTPLGASRMHTAKCPCSKQRQQLPGLGRPGPTSPPSSGSLLSQSGNDRISPKYIVLASLHTMAPSRKSRFTDCLHLGHLQMWDLSTFHIGGCPLGICMPHRRHSRPLTQ